MKSAASTAKPTKKLPKAAVEATAEAFVAGFKALPSAVQWRIIQLIEELEDEADAQELAAARAANPEDFDPANSLPWEQVKAEMDARRTHIKTDNPQREAA